MVLTSEFKEVEEQWAQIDVLCDALRDLHSLEGDFGGDSIERTLEKIKAFEPTISVIGQVKAGKSTLVNALVGKKNFLPSDVNPWTSVVTSIHLNSRRRPPNTRALFRFFDSHEWERLAETGGQLGEIANRSGFDDEASEIRRQVMEMRQATEDRLGEKFQSLLGSSHSFETIEQDTIDRYICYGDPEDFDEEHQEGLFADITKSADLYLDDPKFPANICLRDTPGVNDTFMMREQTTLNAIGESRGCIVVLSAHQALSTMDMALLRIICAIDSREVLIFVNRMDELENPAQEKEKIRDSILKTLNRFGMGRDIEILFGSGYWAQCAQSGNLESIAPKSRLALLSWAEAHSMSVATDEDMLAALEKASGLSDLMNAMARRVSEGPANRLLTEVTEDTKRIIAMASRIAEMRSNHSVQDESVLEDARQALAKLGKESHEALSEKTSGARSMLLERLKRVQETFVSAALDALEKHIDLYGEIDQWNHDPLSLRMSMRAAYHTCCRMLEKEARHEIEMITEKSHELIETELGLIWEDNDVELPILPLVANPSSLARTISIDLNSSWWQKLWSFDRRKKIRTKYGAALMTETDFLIGELLESHFDPYSEEIAEALQDYLDEKSEFFEALVANTSVGSDQSQRNVA